MKDNPAYRHSVACQPGASLLGIAVLALTNIAHLRGEPGIKEQAACVQRRPAMQAVINVEADPMQDEWTGCLVGEVVRLESDYFTLDAGAAGTWDISYTNKWEILE